MIQTKEDLRKWIEEDRRVYNRPGTTSLKQRIVERLFPHNVLAYMKCLRKLEYYTNINNPLRFLYTKRLETYQYRTGIQLPANCAGPGLHLPHGNVIINENAKIGRNCKIHQGVTIGGQGRYDKPGAPVVGDRVVIGAGAKLIGNIRIADDVVIGANAVVVKDVIEPGITVAGIPARKISNEGSYHYLNRE